MPSLPHGGVDRNFPLLSAAASRAVAPSRGRGSKPSFSAGLAQPIGRSLPHGGVDRNHQACPSPLFEGGRSLTGAWIETRMTIVSGGITSRRSLTGAWIETRFRAFRSSSARSLPHGGVDRNKDQSSVPHNDLLSLPHGGVDRNVAAGMNAIISCGRSLTGAWIETVSFKSSPSRRLVAPSRGRGLKRSRPDLRRPGRQSLPQGSVDQGSRRRPLPAGPRD